ncbi:MAG: AzlD domain-containing protein [Chloroflexota bacterium]
MTSIWLVIISVGILTYLTRLSFIMILSHWDTPPIIKRALHYVPIAVFSAIILPELFFYDGALNISVNNPRLLAGMIAIFVAWKTRSVAWTVIVGMIILLAAKTYF